jgi:DNA-binding NarL/FixJ family response regulator
MIKVLIGDDHRIVREGLNQMLADAPDVGVLAQAQTGLEVLKILRREHPGLPVLMLTLTRKNSMPCAAFASVPGVTRATAH